MAIKKPANEDEYFDRLQAFVKTVPGGVGFMITRGVDGERQSSSDESSGGGGREKLTRSRLRRCARDSRRRHACRARAAGRRQADHGIMMFDTSFSWDVLALLHEKCAAQTKKAARTPRCSMSCSRSRPRSASTTCGCTTMRSPTSSSAANKLGKAWAKLLAKSDAELGIDAGTRPGVQALLEFQETVADPMARRARNGLAGPRSKAGFSFRKIFRASRRRGSRARPGSVSCRVGPCVSYASVSAVKI